MDSGLWTVAKEKWQMASLKRSAGSYKLVASKKLAAHPVSSGQEGGNLQTELLNLTNSPLPSNHAKTLSPFEVRWSRAQSFGSLS